MQKRKRAESEYILIAVCSILAMVIIPFTIIRFLSSDYILAILDAFLFVSMVVIILYVYNTGNVRIPGYIAAASFVLGTVFVIYLKGSNKIHWAYPALVVIFYFLQPKVALLLGCLSILAITPALARDLSFLEELKILVTLCVNICGAYLFATATMNQRRKLKKMTQQDPLTKVGNRCAMEEAIVIALEEHQNAQKPMCALMIDIDHFKEINDTRGHQIGDKVLISIAEIIEHNVRTSESVYRYGGEEFLVIAKDMSLSDAERLAERLRKFVEEESFDNEVNVTISIGIAELKITHGTHGWLQEADRALYKAKNNGKNCIETYDCEAA